MMVRSRSNSYGYFYLDRAQLGDFYPGSDPEGTGYPHRCYSDIPRGVASEGIVTVGGPSTPLRV